MERKIGEIFELGGEWYQCLKSKGACSGCIAFGKNYSFCRSFGECTGDTIFKKLEKVGEPYDDCGTILQRFKIYTNVTNADTKGLELHIYSNDTIGIEIKQTKEDMEEKNNGNTPLNVLTDKYVNGDICYDDFEKEVKALYSCKEEIKPTIKKFDLEAAKQGKPVCTRDGRKARIICFDAKMKRNIIALIQDNEFKDEEIAVEYFPNGCFYDNDFDTSLDLMMSPEKRSGWAKVRKDINLYDTKEEADRKMIGNDEYVTAKVCWEE